MSAVPSLKLSEDTGRKPSRKPAKKQKPAAWVEALRRGMTVGLGCFVPVLSLALSKIAGTLATHGLYALAAFAFALTVAVLIVSLPHLAWSVGDITGSGRRTSWSLAVALDMTIVLCEFVHTFAAEAGLDVVAYAITGAVCAFSMLLNCWAFFNDRPAV